MTPRYPEAIVFDGETSRWCSGGGWRLDLSASPEWPLWLRDASVAARRLRSDEDPAGIFLDLHHGETLDANDQIAQIAQITGWIDG